MTLRQRELTVGNRRVASLEALRRLPTKGIADVYDGQFVIVDGIDYADMVGAKNYIALPEQSREWSAPSSGYASLDGVAQYLEASYPKTYHPLNGANGNGFSFWFRLGDQVDGTLLHIPTLSPVYAGNPSNPYGIRGIGLGVGDPTSIHPSGVEIPGNPTGLFNLYITLGFTFEYGPNNLTASGQLARQTGHEIQADTWYNVAVSMNNDTRMLTIYVNGAQVFQVDLIYNPEVTAACQTLSIPQSEITRVFLSGESQVVNHRLILGAHSEESGAMGGFVDGDIDEFFYYNRVLSSAEISTNFYAQGSPAIGLIDRSDCAHYWDVGDQLPVPTEVDTLRMTNLQNDVYLETAETTKIWREATYETQIVVRPLGETPAEGFAETKTYVTLDSSFRGVQFAPGADGGFSTLTSNSTTASWSDFDNWGRGTIVLPFFVDASVLAGAVNASNKYCLLSLGYEATTSGDENGIRVYISGHTAGSLSLHVEIYDTNGTLWTASAENHVEDLAWNMCTISFDLQDTNKTERLSLYLNGSVADVKYAAAPGSYARVTTTATTFRKALLGAIAYEDSGLLKYKDPFYGKIDQVIISSVGDPSDHGSNNLMNEDSAALATTNQISRWKMSADDSFSLDGVYSPTNNIKNTVHPGTPDSISGPDSFGLDLFGMGVDTTDSTTLSTSEGHSGTSLPVPRAVPTNWGTYFFDKDRVDFSEEYSNEPNYGFIVIRPDDRSASQAGRWVSVISYSVWTAYLFGSSESDLRLEEGQLANVEEGDLAVFNNNGRIVPIEPVEQWVSPTFFANAKPRPDSSGYKGQRCYDGTYMYECVAPNMWVRYQIANSWE